MKKLMTIILLLCANGLFAQESQVFIKDEDGNIFTVSEKQPTRPVTELPTVYAPSGKPQAEYTFAIRTNALHWAAMTPNIGVEYRFCPEWGVRVDAGWAKWNLSPDSRHWGVTYVNPELRYYLGKSRNLYVGAAFTKGQFDIFVPKLSKIGRQGNFIGGGATVGYQLPVTESMAIDFNIGIGYTHFKFDTYSSELVALERGIKRTLNYPSQAGVSLVWKINKH